MSKNKPTIGLNFNHSHTYVETARHISDRMASNIITSTANCQQNGPHFGCGNIQVMRIKHTWFTSSSEHTGLYKDEDQLRVDITIDNDTCACPFGATPKRCIKAIRTGYCDDPFIRNVFGETVFKKNYNKQR